MNQKETFTEKEFLEQYEPDNYERPSVSTDILIFTIENIKNPVLKILLIKRGTHPFRGSWALPGGFVGIKESIDDAAKRKLKEETGLEGIYLEQLYTFGEPTRDPRMRVITSAYMAMVPGNSIIVKTGEEADDVKWFSVSHKLLDEKRYLIISDDESKMEMRYHISESEQENGVIGYVKENVLLDANSELELAFDHAEIINMAINRISGKCEYVPILFNLMPRVFTIPELQSVYELFLKKRPHNNVFRKNVSLFIEENGTVDKTSFRPAKQYRFKK